MRNSISADTGSTPETTRDALLAGKVTLWQPREGYRAAIDPVMLAAAVEPKAGAQLLDLGCGVGAVALCLLARKAGITVTGLELDADLVALARRNAAANHVEDCLEIHQGSITAPPADIPPQSFDLVVCNPPYLQAGTATASPEPARRSANIEALGDLAAWIAAAARALKPKGRVAMIHRADRLDRIISELSDGFGEITIHPLWPKQGRPAKRVIVQARKGVSSPARMEAGTVLHTADGDYTDTAKAVLEGAGLRALSIL